jgi:type IV pilus assembly protein PilN
LYSSPWLERPELIEIKAATPQAGAARDQRRLNEFSMRLTLKRPQAATAATAAASAASAAAVVKKSP